MKRPIGCGQIRFKRRAFVAALKVKTNSGKLDRAAGGNLPLFDTFRRTVAQSSTLRPTP
jgi:hypothetical protein